MIKKLCTIATILALVSCTGRIWITQVEDDQDDEKDNPELKIPDDGEDDPGDEPGGDEPGGGGDEPGTGGDEPGDNPGGDNPGSDQPGDTPQDPVAVSVVYSGSQAQVSAPSSVSVTTDGAYVTLDITTLDNVNITVSGTTDNGGLKVYGSKSYYLTLNGASIRSTKGAAINNQCKKALYLAVNPETTNSLEDAAQHTDVPTGEDCKGCLFSEGQIILSGGGQLSVTGKSKHAIAVDDYMLIKSGTSLKIVSSVTDGIHSNRYVQIDGGTINITSGSDGIDTEGEGVYVNAGTLTIESGDEGISAAQGSDLTVKPAVKIATGNITIKTTASKASGIKSDEDIEIYGGKITVTTSGTGAKGLSSNGNMKIAGGTVTLTTSGGVYVEGTDISGSNGIKCDGTLTISDGTVSATASGQGAKGISVDGDIIISGGTIDAIAKGSNYGSSSSSGGGGGRPGGGGWNPGSGSSSSSSKSAKGMKADGNITISGGVINCSSASHEALEAKKVITIKGGEISTTAGDDAINAGTNLVISDGKVWAYTTGSSDAIDSNGKVSITGGLVIAHGAGSPECGIDCDSASNLSITGGTVIYTGGAQSGSPAPGGSNQGYLLFSSFSMTKDNIIRIADSSGKNVAVLKCPKTQSSIYLTFSAPGLSGTYTLYKGATATGTPWNGFYTDLAATGGTSSGTATKK